ncbi:MAG: D-alanine--D-alanine ligase [Parvularculaceae bacterium]|nr:D-alanine--D-alanine ligase [Parvularculaceae bacterium]
MKYKRIAVLKGGLSAEREVSLNSGAACAKALRSKGYDVVEIDVGKDLAARLIDEKPDAVFNALHGQWGEDGCVQGLLEVMGIPYSHSGVLTSSLAMDKQRTKLVLRASGVPSPEGRVMSRHEAAGGHAMEPPYVIKPNAQGSSVGVHIIRKGDNRPPAELLSDQWTLGDEVLVEKFIAGRELTVAVMGDRPLCVTEITTDLAFYDYEAKYAPGGSHHVLPAKIPPLIEERCLDLALLAHRALGCRGVTRSDFRYDAAAATEQVYFLEINTQPGMTATSLTPEQASHCGIAFPDLCQWIIEDASCLR